MPWLRRTIRLVCCTALLSTPVAMELRAPLPVLAALADWKPVFAKNHAKLTLNAVYATDKRTNRQGFDDSTTRQAFRETLALSTLGFVYDPDLMIFSLAGGVGQDQVSLYDDEVLTPGRGGGSNSYNLEALFFRRKPYTLKIYSEQQAPFITSATTGVVEEQTKKSGAALKYRKKAHRAQLKYQAFERTRINDTNSTEFYDSSWDYAQTRFGWLDNFSTNVWANQQNDTANVALDSGKTTLRQETINNRFSYKLFDFSTSASNYTTRYNGNSGTGGVADSISFNHSINAELPWNFTSQAWVSTYSTTANDLQPARADESSADDNEFQFSLTQRLYESLVTNFSTYLTSSTTSASERINGAPLEPISGQNDRSQYRLSTNYSKKLPFNSRLTGTLASSSSQINRVGLSTEVRVSPAIADNGGIITLPDTADTGSTITVEVLAVNLIDNPDDPCKTAITNPRAIRSECWVPLADANDYFLQKGVSPEIRIGAISDNPGLDYFLFDNRDGTFDPFRFRVTYFRKSADATTQTNTVSAGLTLFQFLMTSYQHAESTQEGNYAGSALAEKVLTDTATLGFTLESFSAAVSRQWINSTGEEIITELQATYRRSKKFFNLITVTLNAESNFATADNSTPLGDSDSSSEQQYTCALATTMLIPYIKASLNIENSYDLTKGSIRRLALNSEGVNIETPDTGIDTMSVLENSVALNRSLKIPMINIITNAYVRYRWQRRSGDSTSDNSNLEYGVNGGRSWAFGATIFNLNASYALTGTSYRDSLFILGEETQLMRDDTFNQTSVVLTVTRQLF